MQVTASAPGKSILFGEHAVVYGKPAIAVAVDQRVQVEINHGLDSGIHVKIDSLGLSGYLDVEKDTMELNKDGVNQGILKFILKALQKVFPQSPSEGLEIEVNLQIPVGTGLGSSAAITVATLAAASKYNHNDLSLNQIAAYGHEVELEVQNAASPIDTTLSTYGGAVYLSKNAEEMIRLPINWDMPLVIAYIPRKSNTGELVESVRKMREAYPEVINPILDSMEQITESARKAISDKNEQKIGELMNINQGLLDALGVNTQELSFMVYKARKAGAIGSKLTGAGGGGSILAYCPEKTKKVLIELQKYGKAFPLKISQEGVKIL